MRGQIIRKTAWRRLADLQEALFDAALEVSVDEAEGDAEVGRKLALGLGAIALDGLQEPEHNPRIIGFVAPRRLGHPLSSARATSTLFTA